ncbi:MAG: 50S ribosomal protein L11 methyltransferase [Vicinamibacterales bacterium]
MADYPALDLRFRIDAGTDALQDLLYAALDDFQPLAVQEHEAADGWRVFFREAEARNSAAVALTGFSHHGLLAIEALTVPDEDWARRSQAGLTAVTVGRITVAPPWDTTTAGAAGRILIVIDPSMGFGTGHHQTTRLCLALLQSIPVEGRGLIDVGTGSGVLALAGWKLGAQPVTALDHDPDAIQNARENVAANGAEAAIAVECGELGHFTGAPAQIVTANLTAAVLMAHAARLRALLAPSGALIVSGFSPLEQREVVDAFGVPLESERVEGEWAAALLRA